MNGLSNVPEDIDHQRCVLLILYSMTMMSNRKGFKMKVNEVIKREVEVRASRNGSTFVTATYADVLRYCLSLTQKDNDIVTVTAATKLHNMTLKAQDGSDKKNPFWAIKDKLRKVHSVKAFVCTDYKRAVQNARTKEGNQDTFTPDERSWGQKVSDALTAHFGADAVLKMYIPLNINYKNGDAYLSSYITNIETGEIINYDEVAPFLRGRDISSIQEHQGLEKIVDYKEYTVTNILYIACHKLVFDLVG